MKPNHFRPEIEQLEPRDCPSALVNNHVYHWSNVTGDWTDEAGRVVGNWGLSNWHWQRTGDFDGDGAQEFVARSSSGRFWMLDFYPDGHTRNVALTHWSGGMEWDFHTWVDHDGDGVEDVIGKRGGDWWTAIAGVTTNRRLNAPVSSDAELAARIEADVPGYDNLDHLGKARAVVDWVAVHFAQTSTAAIANASYAQFNLPLWQIYNLNLDGNPDGFFCGGFAYVAKRALHLKGIDAFTVDFGNAGIGLTHVTTVVPKWAGGQWHYYVMDPTFNLSFHRLDGSFATVADLFAGNAVEQSRSLSLRRQVDGGTYFRDYSVDVYRTNFGRHYELHGLDVDNAFVELLRLRIYRVSGSLSPTAAIGFTDRIAQLR